MNSLLLMMGLLVVSYLGSFLVGGRAIRGFGLPSGVEWVALGFLLGPNLLGVVAPSRIREVEPLVLASLGWLALLIGLQYGRIRRLRHVFLALVGSLVTGLLVAAAVYLVLSPAIPFGPSSPLALGVTDRLLLAGGVGLAGSETTRHGVRWVVERHAAEGPLAELLGEFADAEDMAPLLAIAILYALHPVEHARIHVSEVGWLGVTVVLGAVLGVLASVLLGREFRLRESWGVLIGTSLLGIGIAARLGVSVLTVMFVTGVVLSTVSRHTDDIRTMMGKTERSALLPTLLLSGAAIHVTADRRVFAVVAAAVVARLLARLLVGLGVAAVAPPARGHGAIVGVGLLSSGALSLCIGLSWALRFPGAVGDTVLVAAAVFALVGELLGPPALSLVLRRAGEIPDRPTPTPPPPARVTPSSAPPPGASASPSAPPSPAKGSAS